MKLENNIFKQLTEKKYLLLVNNKSCILIESKNIKGASKEENIFATFISIELFEPLKTNGSKMLTKHIDFQVTSRTKIKTFATKKELNDYKKIYKLVDGFDKIEYKLIFSPQLARKLLKNNFKIKDIKQNRNTGDVAFVFLIEDGIYEVIEKWNNSKKS